MKVCSLLQRRMSPLTRHHRLLLRPVVQVSVSKGLILVWQQSGEVSELLERVLGLRIAGKLPRAVLKRVSVIWLLAFEVWKVMGRAYELREVEEIFEDLGTPPLFVRLKLLTS